MDENHPVMQELGKARLVMGNLCGVICDLSHALIAAKGGDAEQALQETLQLMRTSAHKITDPTGKHLDADAAVITMTLTMINAIERAVRNQGVKRPN